MNLKIRNKYLKYTLYSLTIIFAIIGFVFMSVFFAVKLNLTKTKGSIDFNDRYFQEISKNHTKDISSDSVYNDVKRKVVFYQKVNILNDYYPKNASSILNVFTKTGDVNTGEKMFDAINLRLKNNTSYQEKIQGIDVTVNTSKKPDSIQKLNAFDWMNTEEWATLKEAMAKDKKVIDSVATVTGVSSRMIVSVLIGEQIRLFNSSREAFKKWMQPLKILTTETKFSLGVTGIKEFTAIKTETYLKDKKSPFYLGENYEHLLDFQTKEIQSERYARLTDCKNHFYSYLYAAISILQIKTQWEKAGLDISNRPEVLATLFNLGYEVSKPHKDPSVGGSRITINQKVYTFGSLAFEFYYSGELNKEFPLTGQIFTLN